MADAKIVLSATDQTGPAFASARRGFDGLGNAAEMSAKQTAAAMRMLPAQITDVVVSLTSGQKPFTVLLQQGGQLKDVFGGVAPAAKAVGNYVLGMINPMTLAAGGAAALAAAWYQGSQESRELNKALVLTGGFAGVSASQMMFLAAGMAQVSGTRSDAVATLAAVASTGRISSGALVEVAAAAQSLAKVTGIELKEAVKVFTSLGDEPAKASAELNRQYHYLTAATYEQIRALEEEGKKLEAGELAQRTYAAAMKKRTSEITQNLGFLETAWNGVINGAKKAWDAMLGIGRDKTGAEELMSLKQQLDDRLKRGPLNDAPGMAAAWEKGNASLRGRIALLERLNTQVDANAKAQADNDKAQEAAIAATDTVSKWQDQARGASAITRELKKYRDALEAIRKVNPDSDLLKPAAMRAGEQAIRAQYAGSDDAIDAKLRAKKSQIEQLQRDLKMLEDGVKSTYEQGLIGTREYLDREFDLKQNSLQQQLAIAQELERIARGKKNVAAAEQYRADIKRIQDDMNSGWADHANKVGQYTAKVARAIELYKQALAESYNNRAQDITDALGGADLGAVARDELNRMSALRREVEKKRAELGKDLAKGEGAGGISRDQYDQQIAMLDEFYARRIAQEQDYSARSAVIRGDWNVGMRKALNDYMENARDAAGQTAKVFSDAFQGVEDGIVDLVTKGKLDFKSLANSIIADIVRMQVRAQIAGFAKSAGGFNFISAIGNGIFGGGGSSGSSTVDSSAGQAALTAFAHGGAIIGKEASFQKRVDPRVFADAPRYHTGGIAGDEVPAILRRGEGVFTPEQMKALGGDGQKIQVTVHANYTVGDVPTVSMVRQAVADSEKRIAASIGRSVRYGGALA